MKKPRAKIRHNPTPLEDIYGWNVGNEDPEYLYKKINEQWVRDTITYLESRGYKVTKKHATRSK